MPTESTLVPPRTMLSGLDPPPSLRMPRPSGIFWPSMAKKGSRSRFRLRETAAPES